MKSWFKSRLMQNNDTYYILLFLTTWIGQDTSMFILTTRKLSLTTDFDAGINEHI